MNLKNSYVFRISVVLAAMWFLGSVVIAFDSLSSTNYSQSPEEGPWTKYQSSQTDGTTTKTTIHSYTIEKDGRSFTVEAPDQSSAIEAFNRHMSNLSENTQTQKNSPTITPEQARRELDRRKAQRRKDFWKKIRGAISILAKGLFGSLCILAFGVSIVWIAAAKRDV